jgi:hypothetical protein
MTAGCGMMASAPSSLESAPVDVRATAAEADSDGTPEIADVARPMLAVTYLPQRRRGVGYFWIGVIPVDFGLGDLNEVGSGDGFSFGVGLKFTETWRGAVEIAFEKTVNHEVLFDDDPYAAQTGYHERVFAGFRFGATSTRMEKRQPLPYLTAGVSDTHLAIERSTGSDFEAKGFGFYAGLGVELPYADRGSLGFDAKYHTWSGESFAAATFAVLWLSRF